MAAGAECVRFTPEALAASAAGEHGAAAPVLRGLAARKESWADVMSELSDSTDAPDPHSLQDEESEEASPKSGRHSGGESDDGPRTGRRRPADETPLTLASARCAPISEEVRFVIGRLHAFLSNCPVLAHVQLQEGRNGSPTKITAELSDTSLNHSSTKEEWILEPARQALVATAQSSQSVYMIGYCAESFENFYGEGFRATLGAMTPEEEDKACWDTWQWGYCSRPASCRCKHPHKQDLMEVSVFLRKPTRR